MRSKYRRPSNGDGGDLWKVIRRLTRDNMLCCRAFVERFPKTKTGGQAGSKSPFQHRRNESKIASASRCCCDPCEVNTYERRICNFRFLSHTLVASRDEGSISLRGRFRLRAWPALQKSRASCLEGTNPLRYSPRISRCGTAVGAQRL